MSLLILLLVETDLVPEKRYSKGNLVISRSPSNSVIVLILLTEVVAVI